MLERLQEAGDRAVFSIPSMKREEAYERAARLYPDYPVEMDAAGNIIVISPGGISGGGREAEAALQLGIWNKQSKLGKVFGPQSVFRLPNGAKRMPDVAWMFLTRWRQLDEEIKDTYQGIVVPDFVIEIRSRTDKLQDQQDKCREWVSEGALEAWLLDPIERQAYRFRENAEPMKTPEHLLAGPGFMPGFELDLQPVWDND